MEIFTRKKIIIGGKPPLPSPAEPDLPAPSVDKKWVQSDLGYFDFYLDLLHGEKEVVIVGKDVYYWSVILFTQCIKNFITFKESDLVKANLTASIYNTALE